MPEQKSKLTSEAAPPDAGESSRGWWVWSIAGVVIVILVVGALVLWPRLRVGAQQDSGWALTAKVEQRDFVRSIRIHGTVAATQSFTVAAPRLSGGSRGFGGFGGGGGGMQIMMMAGGGGQMTITKLVPSGTRVQPGDVLVEFDPQEQERAVTDQENSYADLEEQIKKQLADRVASKVSDDTNLVEAKNAVEAARLELKKNEVISKIDAEKNQQSYEEAVARLKQIQTTYDLKRASEQAALRINEISRDRSQKAMQHARENVEKMKIRSEMAGMVVLNTNFNFRTGVVADVQEGDQVNGGSIILRVVDPDRMEVRARVNQADAAYLRIGQLAKVRLDAYPDMVFNGRLDQLSPLATTSGLSPKVRYFSATFTIQGSDPKLLPDLSAAVDVELDRVANALVVPRDALLVENNQAYVRVKRGLGSDKRAVKTGKFSDYEVTIESGVQPGEMVERSAARAQGGVR